MSTNSGPKGMDDAQQTRVEKPLGWQGRNVCGIRHWESNGARVWSAAKEFKNNSENLKLFFLGEEAVDNLQLRWGGSVGEVV